MTDNRNLAEKRLAFFLPGLYDGGAERTMLNLANEIAERGYPVDMVLARAEGDFMDAVSASVRVVDLNASRVLASTPALIRYLRRERPFALLSVLHANIIAVWAKRFGGVPVRVVLEEQNNLSSVASGENDIRFHLFPLLARWFYPWADGIVAVSAGVAEDLAHLIRVPRERVQVIFNPIVTPEMFIRSKEGIDHPWFQPAEPPVFLAVGRLTAQKGFDVLIRAFARLRQACPARLLILGEGEDRAALEALVKESRLEQDIRLPGFVPNPYPFMRGAAAFVLSSRWEGLPTVLVEAMSLGTPVIATDCPSGPQEILQGGKYGPLVPVEDPAALAGAMAAVLENRPPCPPPDCWAPYSIETIVEQYLRILSD